jgi:dehydrogenase/reductase SDR family member 12
VTVLDLAHRAADAALEVTVVGGFSRIGYEARRSLFHWDAQPAPDLAGRVVLVTGATGGLGFAAADALARRGAQVWIVGRDAGRTDDARDRIVAATPGAHVSVIVADLASLDDVHECAARVAEQAPRLDALVHNAGALTHELEYTADGIELTAQVHVVAPFLLTTLLLPLLRATEGARVVTVSSGGMYTQPLDLPALVVARQPFNGSRAYANAKRAQVVLNELWPTRPEAAGVTFHAMHPGWADTPGVQASLPRFRSIMRPVLRTPAQGADTIVWLASAPEPLQRNGAFWLDRRPRATSPLPWTRTSPAEAEALWSWCVKVARRAGDRGVPS